MVEQTWNRISKRIESNHKLEMVMQVMVHMFPGLEFVVLNNAICVGSYTKGRKLVTTIAMQNAEIIARTAEVTYDLLKGA